MHASPSTTRQATLSALAEIWDMSGTSWSRDEPASRGDLVRSVTRMLRERGRRQESMLDSGRLAPHERLLVKLVQRDGVRPPLEDDRATVEDAATRARLVRLAKDQGVHGLALSALVASPLLAALSVDVAK